jgi:hypothetical protein
MATFAAFFVDEMAVAARPWLPARRELMCRVHWRYTDPAGVPIPNRRTLFANIFVPSVEGSSLVVGAFASAETDELGDGEILLFRGTECEVIIDQTNVVRRVTIPDQPQVSLTSLVSDALDQFSVQTTTPTGIRRSV